MRHPNICIYIVAICNLFSLPTSCIYLTILKSSPCFFAQENENIHEKNPYIIYYILNNARYANNGSFCGSNGA